MPSHIKTYDGGEDPEDHLKVFQEAAKTERWAMLTWCHMFNATLIKNARVWFDDLPPESIDSYEDLKKAFLKNHLQQKKYIKDPIELHNIKQRDGESTKDFVRRYKLESRDIKGAPECMRISGFVQGITNPELIKRNNMDECMHLRKQIEEMLKARKLSHLIKEIKQTNKKEQSKVTKKGETSRKDKALAILMVQPEDEGPESPMVIEAEIEGHCVHCMCVEGGSASEIIGEIIWPIGQIQLLVKIEDEEHSALAWMNFMIVRSQSSYNGISGRPRVKKLQVVPSTAHGMVKILVEGEVITLKSSKFVPLECAMVSGPAETPSATKPIAEERFKVAINPEYPEQTVMIGSTLTEGGPNKLCGLLQRNLDIFAWKPADVTGVPRHIAEHRLNMREGCSPIRQNWRMCVDFKDLNKACPKDDAYKGYHQIQMATEDEDKTAFITSQGIFCYTKMPFGLRNAGATYQRLVDKAFHKQIGRNLEVYMDGHVIKSRTKDEIVRDVEETFKTLREINMKLNIKKCAFGVEERTFPGYKVNAKGVKVCPNKVDDVLSLPSPKRLKDVQKLNEKLASRNSDFRWSTEAKEAFKLIKQLITELPILTAPMEKEELIVYLAAAKETVSAVLMTEREAKQMSIYFVSKALRGPELNYTSMEKVDGFRVRLILTNPEGMEFTYALRFRGDATNNEAEYEALIYRLRIAEQMGVKNLQENVDSRLVANQVNGTHVAKETNMIGYLEKVKALTESFKAFSIKQIPRSKNKKTDALSKIASTSFTHLSKQVLVEELKEKSISEIEILAVVEEEGDTWMTPLFKYLAEGTLPADVKKARAIKRKSWRFTIVKETLYKKSFFGPWLRCGIDIAGPFPEGPGKVKFLIVVMDYFTKWIEAKPVATITGNQIKKLCRAILSAGLDSLKKLSQIMENSFGTIRSKIGAKNYLRRRNKSKVGCKKQELDRRANPCSMGTPHNEKIKQRRYLVLINIRNGCGHPGRNRHAYTQNSESRSGGKYEAREIDLDLLGKRREKAAIREAKSKAKIEKYYNSKVRNTSFNPGDLVYRNNDASRAEDTGKLGPKWEGAYEVTKSLGKRAYKLRGRDGKQLPRTWNISNLKKCHIQKM
nr:reverse transcriptase domain-containing protein [Tanacetum cinerariifolium]